MSMPSFLGSWEAAGKAGFTTCRCAHCQNWMWVAPEDADRPGRRFCGRRECERRETEARRAES